MTPAVTWFAAGCLQAPLTRITVDVEQNTGLPADTVFGPSGLLCERIEAGESADVFASADIGHPQRLAAAGRQAREIADKTRFWCDLFAT